MKKWSHNPAQPCSIHNRAVAVVHVQGEEVVTESGKSGRQSGSWAKQRPRKTFMGIRRTKVVMKMCKHDESKL